MNVTPHELRVFVRVRKLVDEGQMQVLDIIVFFGSYTALGSSSMPVKSLRMACSALRTSANGNWAKLPFARAFYARTS